MNYNGPVKIDGQIFMGNGQLSMIACYHLHQRLEEALSTLSGIQQPPRVIDSTDVFKQFEEDYKEGVYEIERVAREICMGLTGKKIKFIEDKD